MPIWAGGGDGTGAVGWRRSERAIDIQNWVGL
jgi:hypothetical protein